MASNYSPLMRNNRKFAQQLQYCTHPHSTKTNRILSKMRLFSGLWRSRVSTRCPFYRVPKHSSFIGYKYCISRGHGTTAAVHTDIPHLRYGRIHFDALRKDVHSSFRVTRSCAENRSVSSGTRRRNSNHHTLPISLQSVLTAANERYGSFEREFIPSNLVKCFTTLKVHINMYEGRSESDASYFFPWKLQ